MSFRDDNLLDAVIYYVGVVLAVLGIGLAGASLIKAMLLK